MSPSKQGERPGETGRKVRDKQKKAPVRISAGGRPYVCERTTFCVGAPGRNSLSFLRTRLLGEVEPAATFTHLPETRMLALAKAVEIGLGGVALQSAEHHKVGSRGIAQPQASPAKLQNIWERGCGNRKNIRTFVGKYD